jgi:protein-S-isoprenylcysteine O-methyltransferase
VRLPDPGLLGLLYGASELGLSIFKRSGTNSRDTDRRSLRLLWTVILCSVAGAVVAVRGWPQARSDLLSRLYPVGVALFAVGLALRWYAILYLGRYFTVDVAIAADHRVIDTGPYRHIRHPSYAGALLAFAGYGICLGNWASLALVTVPIAWAFLRRIEVEEAALNGALGSAYAKYLGRSKRLVPFVY